MPGTLHDFKFAARFLLRNRGFAVAAVGMLALGISLSATLYAIVRATLIDPWPYRGYDRLITLSRQFPTQGRTDYSLWSAAEIEDLRHESGVFEDVIAGDARNVNVTYAGQPERVRAAIITPNAFRMLGVAALLGRGLVDADAGPGAPPVVVVNYRFWRARLGANPAAVGASLRTGDATYTIVGVMPERFVFWDRDLWMPLRLDRGGARDDRRFYAQGMLRRDVGIDAAAAALRSLSLRLARDHPERPEYANAGITPRLLTENVIRDLRPTLYLLLTAVALVLAVASANVANAMLAKGLAREGELAIRRALGGSGPQIGRQLLAETILVGIAGGLAGAAAAAFLLPQILALIPFGYVPAEARVALDWQIVVLAAIAAAGCGIAIGLVPAFRAANVDPAAVLRRGDARTGSLRRHWWRDAFIVLQLVVATIVVGVAGAATVNLRNLVIRDPGYNAHGVWTARLALWTPDAVRSNGAATYAAILDRLRQDPAVGSAAMAGVFPVGAQSTTLVSAEANESARRLAAIDADSFSVSTDFFRLLEIPLVDGRSFLLSDDAVHPDVVVLTRSLARRIWPEGSAIGRRVFVGEHDSRSATVIGVVGDVHTGSVDFQTRPSIFFALAQRTPPAVVVGLRTVDSDRALAILRDAVRLVDPDIPVYSPATLDRERIAALGPKLLAVTLLMVFALAVLAISSAGVYAVVSQSVQERSQEWKIRLAFGADPARLLQGELRRSGELAAAAVLAGTAASAAALRGLSGVFAGFAVTAAPLVAAGLALFAVAVLATAWPAWRAAHPTALN